MDFRRLWADPRTTTGRYNAYYSYYYNSYQYALTSQPDFLENTLTLEAIATDPNVPELETGGIEYTWTINVRDGDTKQYDISTIPNALNNSLLILELGMKIKVALLLVTCGTKITPMVLGMIQKAGTNLYGQEPVVLLGV